jgi:hypothetical protein
MTSEAELDKIYTADKLYDFVDKAYLAKHIQVIVRNSFQKYLMYENAEVNNELISILINSLRTCSNYTYNSVIENLNKAIEDDDSRAILRKFVDRLEQQKN